MTKRRAPLSIEAAVQTIYEAIGVAHAAEVLGMTERRAWDFTLSQDDGGRPIHARAALALDVEYVALTGKPAPILAAWTARVERVSRDRPCACDPGERVIVLTAVLGQAAAMVAEAQDPNGPGGAAVVASELRTLKEAFVRIRAELDQAIDQIDVALLGNRIDDAAWRAVGGGRPAERPVSHATRTTNPVSTER
ncbi:hypothetical protein F1188_11150 [Roseospira marina]|uniref:Uncharacterized protein n=1 Tax=Roseospira marina TaxID=140057 RepID=A0A5M6ICU7_9PROT|nr:hypothetical protein [Roseospira marina]KAA5605448.1 hypothetical protein F1188_11150 [Roseospira marina]MBB4314554.1 hypothetical protein [Roseospira marina]MBB5088884.1 hypothetical protein [Roseospira marina]